LNGIYGTKPQGNVGISWSGVASTVQAETAKEQSDTSLPDLRDTLQWEYKKSRELMSRDECTAYLFLNGDTLVAEVTRYDSRYWMVSLFERDHGGESGSVFKTKERAMRAALDWCSSSHLRLSVDVLPDSIL
jgi:hypothetical protein